MVSTVDDDIVGVEVPKAATAPAKGGKPMASTLALPTVNLEDSDDEVVIHKVQKAPKVIAPTKAATATPAAPIAEKKAKKRSKASPEPSSSSSSSEDEPKKKRKRPSIFQSLPQLDPKQVRKQREKRSAGAQAAIKLLKIHQLM